MTTTVDRKRVLGALVDEWAAIDAVVDDLTDEQWHASSPCPGWRVRDVLAHVVGTERMLLGDSPAVGPDDDEWNAVGFTPAGQDTHGRFMRIRVYDCWLHEQDIRDGAGLPGRDEGAGVAVALDEMETALGFIVG